MNKKRIEQILRVLLMPFISMDFFEEKNDIICEYYEALYQLKETSSENFTVHKKAVKRVKQAIEEMNNYFFRHRELIYTTIDDTRMLLEKFYSRDCIYKILKKAENMETEADGKEVFAEIYMNMLVKIAESLLTFRNGILSIRTWNVKSDEDIFEAYGTFNKVEIWNTLNRLMATDILNVLYYLECDMNDRRYLRNEYGRISLSDNLLDVVLDKGIAENHMHFSVAYNYSGIWINYMNVFYLIDKKLDKIFGKMAFNHGYLLFVVGAIRLLAADYIVNYNEADNFKEYADKMQMLETLMHFSNGDIDEKREVIEENCRQYIVSQYNIYKRTGKNEKDNMDILMHLYFEDCINQNTTSESVLLFEWVKHMRKTNDKFMQLCLIQYIRVKNSLFSHIFQNNSIQGLEYFEFYFRNATMSKNPYKLSYDNWVKVFLFKNQMQNPKLKKLEIRITPDVNISQNLYKSEYKEEMLKEHAKNEISKLLIRYFEAYLHCCQEVQRLLNVTDKELDLLFAENKISMPTIGIVFHFIKDKLIENIAADSCWLTETEEQKLLPVSNVIHMRKRLKIIGMAIAELRNEVPLLGDYIVGIDAASSENNTEPWIFAPVYKAVRNKNITKTMTFSDDRNYLLQNIGFTYHVGEDFRHIVSGLRHIDEVVEKFTYKHGDRLGHAIALGINIEDWMRENEVVVMPLSEHVDNLLWILGLIMENRLNYPISMLRLESEIFNNIRKVYGNNITGITIDILYRVYSQKFLINYQQNIFKTVSKRMTDISGEGSGRFFCKYNKNNGVVTWDEEMLFCTQFCPIYREKLEQPVWVKVNKEDLEMFRQIQIMVMKNIEKKGIIAEVNPTSNTAISSIKGIFGHYVTNLNNMEEGDDKAKVMVMINSDDPGVMCTDVENELAYIYHKLLYQGMPVEKAIQWIEKIRGYGMDFSFIKTIKKPSIMIDELGKIICSLEKK